MAIENVTPKIGSFSELPTISIKEKDTTMADTIIAQPQDGLMGGGTLGGLILGSMFANRGGLFGGNGVDGAALGGTNQILQSLNQQQLASATQIMTQDINRTSRDVATAAAETQAAVAASTLTQTVATLQGQTDLTKSIMDSTAQNSAGHTNIMNGQATLAAGLNSTMNSLASDLNNGLHDLGTQFTSAIHQTQDEISRSTNMLLGAAHSAEVNQLKSANDTNRLITDESEKTRALITNNTIMDLQRQLVEARDNHRHDRTTSDLIINNNNNNSLLAQQMQQQTQQQQIATVANGLSTVLGHLNNIQQISIATGRNNTITPNAVNV